MDQGTGRARRTASAIAGIAVACLAAACEGETAEARPASATVFGEVEVSPARMAEAARTFLASLSPDERTAAEFPLDADTARTSWSNLPASIVTRGGARVGDFTDLQRRHLHDLLRASTSSQGYQKMAGVVRLDEVLHEEAVAAVASGERPRTVRPHRIHRRARRRGRRGQSCAQHHARPGQRLRRGLARQALRGAPPAPMTYNNPRSEHLRAVR